MPAAIPAGIAVGGSLLGDVLQNGQNKAAVQNAQNATQSAREADAAALQKALAGLQQYVKQNPSPASQYGAIKGPTSVYGQPGATTTAPTSSVNGNGAAGGTAASLLGALGPNQGNGMQLPIMRAKF